MGRVVLVAGVAQYLGGRFARLLARDPDVSRVVGVDVVPPEEDLDGVEFVRADIRKPVIAKVLARVRADTVAHLNGIAASSDAGGRASMKEINVIGTMQLLAACQKVPTVRRLVVKSTGAVYGASCRDPAMFTEETDPRSAPTDGWGRDATDVEGYVRDFSRRRPDVEVSVLRLADVLGSGIRSPLTEYFGLPVLPTVAGFDARLQFLHEDDALEALRRATVGPACGVVNVAGDGVITLSQAARLSGRPVVPVPQLFSDVVGQMVRRLGVVDFSSDQVRFLSFGRGMDTTRMRQVLGLSPRFTTRQAFCDVMRRQGVIGPVSADRVARAERGALDLVRTLSVVRGVT
jgi:UDP-glucose 4-epimerase